MTPLSFDSDGWLHLTSDETPIYHTPTKRIWSGMHPTIMKDYNNQLHGTVTHYDALPSAKRAVSGFTRGRKGPSTHFVISRAGEIYQLASIEDRTWHAGFKRKDGKIIEWPENNGRMLLANGVYTKSPNQWMVGIDFSNWGWLDERGGLYYSWADSKVDQDLIYYDENGRAWESYTDEAIDAYIELMVALTLELDIERDMHYRHCDTSPTRKDDPGPALPFFDLLDEIYHIVDLDLPFFNSFLDIDRQGDSDAL